MCFDLKEEGKRGRESGLHVESCNRKDKLNSFALLDR